MGVRPVPTQAKQVPRCFAPRNDKEIAWLHSQDSRGGLSLPGSSQFIISVVTLQRRRSFLPTSLLFRQRLRRRLHLVQTRGGVRDRRARPRARGGRARCWVRG